MHCHKVGSCRLASFHCWAQAFNAVQGTHSGVCSTEGKLHGSREHGRLQVAAAVLRSKTDLVVPADWISNTSKAGAGNALPEGTSMWQGHLLMTELSHGLKRAWRGLQLSKALCRTLSGRD